LTHLRMAAQKPYLAVSVSARCRVWVVVHRARPWFRLQMTWRLSCAWATAQSCCGHTSGNHFGTVPLTALSDSVFFWHTVGAPQPGPAAMRLAVERVAPPAREHQPSGPRTRPFELIWQTFGRVIIFGILEVARCSDAPPCGCLAKVLTTRSDDALAGSSMSICASAGCDISFSLASGVHVRCQEGTADESTLTSTMRRIDSRASESCILKFEFSEIDFGAWRYGAETARASLSES